MSFAYSCLRFWCSSVSGLVWSSYDSITSPRSPNGRRVCVVVDHFADPHSASHPPSPPKLPQGTSRKKILRVERQERAAEEEANFLAKIFHSGMDDWEEVDIFNE